MKKTAAVFLTLLLAIAGIGLPIWLAIEESERQAYKAESVRALGFASDILVRADETGRQARGGVDRLKALHADNPCSPAAIDLMREIDLGSSYLQAIGYIERNQMLCSSIAGQSRVLDLGPPDYTTSAGAAVRRQVRFPFAAQNSFIVLEFDSFAAIIHQRLIVDMANSEPDIALAVLSLEDPAPIIVRGKVKPEWLRRLGRERQVVFVDNGSVVAVVRSQRFLTAGVAAVPISYLESRSEAVARRLVPAGLVAGVMLVAAIMLLGRQQMSLPNAVKMGLRRKEFFLEYQPVVELATGRCVGVEALVRWRRPTGEVVMPDLFVAIAEDNGMIVRLTGQVLEMVAHDTRHWLAAHPDFHVGINVAPADFYAGNLLLRLQETLEAMGAAPGNLILEVTERGLMDPVVARENTANLRRHGFALAIDDFGTGYSSLSYLETLELDYLKIDRSFIEAIGTGAPTSQVVQHIIRIAKDLGLRMIAEGVESQAQADFLRKHGVQFGQGWLFGRPVSFGEVVRQMEAAELAEAALVRAAG
ncbi:EAL domain-containing protein [Massilia yuzhufengensis]|uniref:cyclic-guanylate-specific phosphodiesterase n=1 Tax=Massilia yuzhufengensis TaxID=1164594 RepID=A0A1I1R0P6_9BURK|nr:EAL domain-containing protein [Massilia yuzhufengensis]SFD25103.1 sensor c-di-GMP phosphodiesterase, contains CSS-motif sensor and EAL domain [Massilia yuzhufengensis]